MATLYIAEHAGVAGTQIGGNYAPIVSCPGLAEQTVAIGGTHAESAAFNANTTIIRVHTDAICSISIGAAPVATTAFRRMAANATEMFGVRGGQILSVIANT